MYNNIIIMQFDNLHQSYILGPSTIWLIYPIINDTYIIIKSNDIIIVKKIIICNIFMVTISSLFNWYFLNKNKLCNYIDSLLAKSLFCLMIYYHICYSNYHYIIQIIIPIIIIIFYYSGKPFRHNNYILIDTLCHYTFRFIGYWWVFLAFYYDILHNSYLYFVYLFIINTIIYYAHILYLIIYFKYYGKDFIINLYSYLYGCIYIINLIIINHLIICNLFITII